MARTPTPWTLLLAACSVAAVIGVPALAEGEPRLSDEERLGLGAEPENPLRHAGMVVDEVAETTESVTSWLSEDDAEAQLAGAPPEAGPAVTSWLGEDDAEAAGASAAAAVAAVASAPAAPPVQVASAMGAGWRTLGDRQLDRVRGGFVTPSGLVLSFGIERAVYINGQLVTTTRLQLSELGQISATGAPMTLVQNGAVQQLRSDALPGAIGTVIQNSLDGQRIQSVTTINATVNSADILRAMNLHNTLRSAVVDSLRR